MITHQAIYNDEMIGEFLQAELVSSRFREGSLKGLEMLHFSEDLLTKPDYRDAKQNEQREKVLHLTRGWPNEGLFTGFPEDVVWLRATLTQAELAKAFRSKSNPDMTDDERLLEKVAATIKAGSTVANIDNTVIYEIVNRLRDGGQATLPPVILVTTGLEDRLVIIEGHSRAVAYTVAQLENVTLDIPAIIGFSPSMDHWAYY